MYKPSFATAVRTTLATAALVTTTLTATAADLRPAPYKAVSYTHLTLPTIYSV